MSEERLCLCGCQTVLNARNLSGYTRGHDKRVLREQMSVERKTAEVEGRNSPEPEPSMSVDDLMFESAEKPDQVLVCTRHGTMWTIKPGVARPPLSGYQPLYCDKCREEYQRLLLPERREQRYIDVAFHTFPHRVSHESVTAWRARQIAAGEILPASIEESTALAEIDAAREIEDREIEKHRRGHRPSHRRSYVRPAFRDNDDY